jgi:hypothetical protein
MKQFILVEEDLVDAYNGQINFLKHNDDLFKTEIKNTKQFNLVVCHLARGISFQACSGVLEDVAQESRSHILGLHLQVTLAILLGKLLELICLQWQ